MTELQFDISESFHETCLKLPSNSSQALKTLQKYHYTSLWIEKNIHLKI